MSERLHQMEDTRASALSDALRDLEQVADEAREDGSPVPSPVAHRTARHLLEWMYRMCPLRYSVYPLYNGEIVIEAISRNKDSVLVVCRSEGDLGCFVNLEARAYEERYSDLPSELLRDALRELGGSGAAPRRPRLEPSRAGPP